MEPHDDTLMTPFDHLISSQDLQMLKLFIPYTPPSNQSLLAVYVKFMEFQRTLSVFQNPKQTIHMQTLQNASPLDMLTEIKPYLPKQSGEQLDQLLNMMSMMEMFSSFQSMNEESDGQGMNPMDMMKGMMTPEQQSMFDTYSTMFSGQDMETSNQVKQDEDRNEKGYENNGHECMDEQSTNEGYGPNQAAADSKRSGTDFW